MHSLNVVHGDIKAVCDLLVAGQGLSTHDFLKMNVLIDDSFRAVLCDLGLSRIRADASTRMLNSEETILAGSRNWMAPERLMGGGEGNKQLPSRSLRWPRTSQVSSKPPCLVPSFLAPCSLLVSLHTEHMYAHTIPLLSGFRLSQPPTNLCILMLSG